MSEVRRVSRWWMVTRREWCFAALAFGGTVSGLLSACVFALGFVLGCSNPVPPPNLPFPDFEPPAALEKAVEMDVETGGGADAALLDSDKAVIEAGAKIIDSAGATNAAVTGTDVTDADAMDMDAANAGDALAADAGSGETDAGRLGAAR